MRLCCCCRNPDSLRKVPGNACPGSTVLPGIYRAAPQSPAPHALLHLQVRMRLYKLMFRSFVCTVLLACGYAHAQTEPGPLLLQQPTLNATSIVFVYGGYLWSVDRNGGAAVRLTSGPGAASNPKFSPRRPLDCVYGSIQRQPQRVCATRWRWRTAPADLRPGERPGGRMVPGRKVHFVSVLSATASPTATARFTACPFAGALPRLCPCRWATMRPTRQTARTLPTCRCHARSFSRRDGFRARLLGELPWWTLLSHLDCRHGRLERRQGTARKCQRL